MKKVMNVLVGVGASIFVACGVSTAKECTVDDMILPAGPSVGVPGGKPFDDIDMAARGPISKIEMWDAPYLGGTAVHGIWVTYTVPNYGAKVGMGDGPPRGRYTVLDLKPGEYVARITVGVGTIINYLCFYTNTDRKACSGVEVGKFYFISDQGHPLASLSGAGGEVLNSLRFRFGRFARILPESITLDAQTLGSQISKPTHRSVEESTDNQSLNPVPYTVGLKDSFSETTSMSFTESSLRRNSWTQSSRFGGEINLGSDITGINLGKVSMSSETQNTTTQEDGQSKFHGHNIQSSFTEEYTRTITVAEKSKVKVITDYSIYNFDMPFTYESSYYDLKNGQETEVCQERSNGHFVGTRRSKIDTTIK